MINRYCRHIQQWLLLLLLVFGNKSYGQDSSTAIQPFILSLSPTWQPASATFFRYYPSFNYFDRSPGDEDEENYNRYEYLLDRQPDAQNYYQYYLLACSLWQLGKNKPAEKMFLAIIRSKENYYTKTDVHSSDIPGDSTTNIYGYGSFTTNYKNYAALYLTKIRLQQKRYAQALAWLQLAVNKYKAQYTCGTGYRQQQEEYNYLYARCYEGLGKHDAVIKLLLPECLERDDEIIIRCLSKKYSPAQLRQQLLAAERSLRCTFDKAPRIIPRTIYSGGNEQKDTVSYYSGEATVKLFGKIMKIRELHLENGDRANKALFLNEFRQTLFYTRLAKIAGLNPGKDN